MQPPSVECGPARLDLTRIRSLAFDLDNPAAALRFLAGYLGLLPGRISRIQESLRELDREASMDAVLSLKITSAMAGALEAEATCRDLESLIRDHRLDEAAAGSGRLNQQVQALTAASPALLVAAREDLLACRVLTHP
ncbi:MAG: hypothetical protein JWQ75_2600 [Pseudarthrobacter sp.]|nr:hypothetical protein [Pseudarthrobacter sp.]